MLLLLFLLLEILLIKSFLRLLLGRQTLFRRIFRRYIGLVYHELVLIEGKLFHLSDFLLGHVDATLMILKLLLCFKSLLAFCDFALKFILVLYRNIMLECLKGAPKCRISNLRSLYHSLDSTLIAKVRAA